MIQQVDSGRMVLDANIGIANVVTREKFVPLADTLLNEIIESLSHFCGPHSKYALIIALTGNNELGQRTATGSHFDTKVFTKDGINILQMMEHLSPIMAYIKTLLTYIGERVDAACNDGTTTSIMFSAKFLQELLKHTGDLHCNSHVFEAEFKAFYQQVLDRLDERRFTLDRVRTMLGVEATAQDAGACIAWMQAYTSSGGDVELATEISKIFHQTDPAGWTHIDKVGAACETSEYRYRCKQEPYAYRLDGNLQTTQHQNYNHRREYREENVRLLAIPENIYEGSPMVDRIVNYIRDVVKKEDGRPFTLVILTSGMSGETVHRILTMAATIHKGIKVVVVAHASITKARTSSNIDWAIRGLNAVAGVESYEYDPDSWIEDHHVVHGVTVHTDVRHIYFHDLYRTPGVPFTALEQTEQSPCYQEFLSELTEHLDRLRNRHNKDPEEIEELAKILVDVKTPRKHRLHIGGLSHDQVASDAVVKDALGAAIAALDHGFYTNGVSTLSTVLSDLPTDEYHFLDMFEKAAETVNKAIGICPNSSAAVALLNDPDIYLDALTCTTGGLTKFVQELYSQLRAETPNFEKLLALGCPPLQVARVFPELFVRIRELLIRFGTTQLIMVPGAAWANKQQD